LRIKRRVVGLFASHDAQNFGDIPVDRAKPARAFMLHFSSQRSSYHYLLGFLDDFAFFLAHDVDDVPLRIFIKPCGRCFPLACGGFRHDTLEIS
jgi:hypothetical protein